MQQCGVCGCQISEVWSRAKKVKGTFMCDACAKNPTGSLRYYCTSCSTYSTKTKMKGNGWIELVLYLCYLVPGIIYSVWRRSGNNQLCVACGSSKVISAESGSHVKCPDCRELVLSDARKCKHCGCALQPQDIS